MDYAAIALAFGTGMATGAALMWWRAGARERARQQKPAGKPRLSRVDDEELRRFRMANNAMEKLIDAERFDDAYNVARNWCNRAPQFVESWRRLKGEFDLKKLPPLEYAAQHLVATRNVAELRKLREAVMGADELKPWQDLLVEEIVAANALTRIFDLVERNPGITEETAARKSDASIRRAKKSLHDADLRNMIRRERDGNSYALYLE